MWLDTLWWILYDIAAVIVWAFLILRSAIIKYLSVNILPVKTETRKRGAITMAFQ